MGGALADKKEVDIVVVVLRLAPAASECVGDGEAAADEKDRGDGAASLAPKNGALAPGDCDVTIPPPLSKAYPEAGETMCSGGGVGATVDGVLAVTLPAAGADAVAVTELGGGGYNMDSDHKGDGVEAARCGGCGGGIVVGS